MIITYHGENYFKLQAGNTTVLINPTNLRSFRGADLVLESERMDKPNPVEGDFLAVDSPGEYEVKGVRVSGFNIPEEAQKTIYRLEIDEMRVGIFGNLKNDLGPKILENFFRVDVLIAPPLSKTVKQIEPSLFVMAPEKNLKNFLKDLGRDKCETEEKIVVKKKDLKPKGIVVRCLK